MIVMAVRCPPPTARKALAHVPIRLPEPFEGGPVPLIPVVVVLLPLLLAGCNGIDMGINPGPDVRKEQGPLTRPPPGVLRGTAM